MKVVHSFEITTLLLGHITLATTAPSLAARPTSDLVVTTSVSSKTFTITFLPTAAPQPTITSGLSSNAPVSSGAPIWWVPILPIGWIGSPPLAPPNAPEPPPPEDGSGPEETMDPTSTTVPCSTISSCTQTCSLAVSISDHTVRTSTDCPTNLVTCATTTACSSTTPPETSTTNVMPDIPVETDSTSNDILHYVPLTDDDGLNVQAPLSNGDLDSIEAGFFMRCDSPPDRDTGIAMDYTFLNGLAEAFCQGDLSQAVNRTLSNKDLLPPAQRLRKRTPPPSRHGYPGYSVTFTYTPGIDGCSGTCATRLNELITQCTGSYNTRVSPSGLYQQSLTCGGVYTYSIYVPPSATTHPAPTPAPECSYRPYPLTPLGQDVKDQAHSHISEFCSKYTGSVVHADSATPTSNMIAATYLPDSPQEPQLSTTISYGNDSADVVEYSVASVGDHGWDCEGMRGKVVDECPSQSGTIGQNLRTYHISSDEYVIPPVNISIVCMPAQMRWTRFPATGHGATDYYDTIDKFCSNKTYVFGQEPPLSDVFATAGIVAGAQAPSPYPKGCRNPSSPFVPAIQDSSHCRNTLRNIVNSCRLVDDEENEAGFDTNGGWTIEDGDAGCVLWYIKTQGKLGGTIEQYGAPYPPFGDWPDSWDSWRTHSWRRGEQ